MTSTAATQWLTLAQVAERLGVDKRTVARWISSGDLIPFRNGRVVRIPLDEFERFTKKHCR